MYRLQISNREYPFSAESLVQAMAAAGYTLSTVRHCQNVARLQCARTGRTLAVAQQFERRWVWQTVGGAK